MSNLVTLSKILKPKVHLHLLVLDVIKQMLNAVVVDQLVEPEIHGSIPIIGNFIYYLSTGLKTVLKRQK